METKSVIKPESAQFDKKHLLQTPKFNLRQPELRPSVLILSEQETDSSSDATPKSVPLNDNKTKVRSLLSFMLDSQ